MDTNDTTIKLYDLAEIGPAFRAAESAPYTGRGRLEPDDVTGLRGQVTRIDTMSGDVQITIPDGSVWWVHGDRVRPVVRGEAMPSKQERGFAEYQRTGMFPR